MFIPLCEHDSNVKAVEERAATCTEEGHTAYWQCQTCGKYFTDEKLTIEISWEDTVIPALGHKTELRNAKEATCTEDGYTGDEVLHRLRRDCEGRPGHPGQLPQQGLCRSEYVAR